MTRRWARSSDNQPVPRTWKPGENLTAVMVKAILESATGRPTPNREMLHLRTGRSGPGFWAFPPDDVTPSGPTAKLR